MRIVINATTKRLVLLLIVLLLIMLVVFLYILTNNKGGNAFDEQRAYQLIEYQMSLGPRVPGTPAHQQVITWIMRELEKSGWEVELQATVNNNVPIKNIVAKRGSGSPWIIIGSHYDSRQYADRDATPEGRKLPVPGANDGASSVAVLMELARDLPKNLDFQIWLVFFDAEDISGNKIAVGSQYFVDQLVNKPDQVVILDMIGDKELNIYMEKNSDAEINQQIWAIAAELGYSQFIPQYKNRILDDHIPFINAGIKAADIIDIDYPYWHTTHDTIDKISAESLKIVGDVILKWIESIKNQQ